MGELGLSQRRAAAKLGLSQQSLSDRALGNIPWRLNEIEAAAVTLEMDLTSILAPVDDDLELTLTEPLDDVADHDIAV
jgi:transcriptional regulator with XRE-family HTH domain